MKKIISLILIIATLCAAVILCSSCVSPLEGGLLFTEIEEGYQVTGISDWGRFYKNFTVDIPSEYNGKPVIAISDDAFLGYTSLIQINLPETIRHIGAEAFSGCIMLQNINMPDALTTIGNRAFWGCLSLQKLEFGENSKLNKIGERAFNNCDSLFEIILPDGVTHIGQEAFAGCVELKSFKIPLGLTEISERMLSMSSIESIEIPDTVKSIGAYAFFGCDNIKEIKIGDGVTSIEGGAFYECTNLAKIELGNSITKIDFSAFTSCDALEYYEYENGCYLGSDDNPTMVLMKLNNNPISFVMSDSTVIAAPNTFEGCYNLTYLTIGNSLLEIPEEMCQDMYLESLIMGDSVVKIGNSAFLGCQLPKELKLNDGLISIGEDAFRGTENINHIELPDSVVSIGKGAFSYSTLKTIKFSKSLEKIESATFEGCYYLESISIPDSVKFIGDGAFFNCEHLKSVQISDSLVMMGDDVFGMSGVTYNEYQNGYYLGNLINPYVAFIGVVDDPQRISEFVLHEDTKIIASGAFSGQMYLGSITIPSQVKSIGDLAFSNCEFLYTVNITGPLMIIGERAFSGCAHLTEITLPDTVMDIGDYAFEMCHCIQGLLAPQSLIRVGHDIFRDCDWITFEEDEGFLYWGNGENFYMVLMGYGSAHCDAINPDTKVIASGAIGGEYSHISNIILPQGLIGIGERAISTYDGSGLSIVIPKSVMYIGEYAFYSSNGEFDIYCEAEFKPHFWENNWDKCVSGWDDDRNNNVVWGYTGQ